MMKKGQQQTLKERQKPVYSLFNRKSVRVKGWKVATIIRAIFSKERKNALRKP